MPQWRARDVMNTEVVTTRDDASFAEIAAMLAGRRISAAPIVDRFDVVVGVVSWTDLRYKIDITGVIDRLAFDINDSVAAAGTSEPVDRDLLCGRWIGHQTSLSVGGVAGDRLPGHSAYARKATRSAALR